MKNNVDKIYENREKFIVIGLTGKTGSGCSTVAKILEDGYQDYNAIDCSAKLIQNRKSEIIKKFASKNFIDNEKKFKIIKPSTILMMIFLFEKQVIVEKIKKLKFILDKQENSKDLKKEIDDLKNLKEILNIFKDENKHEEFNDFFDYVNNIDINDDNQIKQLNECIKTIKNEYEDRILKQDNESLKTEVKTLFGCDDIFINSLKIDRLDRYQPITIQKGEERKKIIIDKIDKKREVIDLVIEHFAKEKSEDFIKLYEKYNKVITERRNDRSLKTKQLQIVGDLVREHINIFQLPFYSNLLIKAYRKVAEKKSCYIVVDSLKNPFEILYFKERYSAYYTFSIHAKDEIIYQRVANDDIDIEAIHKKELNLDDKDKQRGSLDSSKDFVSQNVIECIQRSDVYIDNNQDKRDTLYKQIFRYLSLIVHPGLITPSKDEMIMQLALNAKFNSGCISRQVGAVVLNKYDSVKAIGWNEVPEGQVPCLLRSHNELLNNSALNIYSKYEKTKIRIDKKFQYIFSDKKPNQYEESNKKGLNDSFCFKSIQNGIEGERNQVYTRSLHAEENAFLQASKYGNSEIIGGQLFTTASPCFLCAKKAYQLGMKRIVYIEAYPDISNEQVFEIGNNEIEMVHFRGAIGLAYQKLYEPIFSYKDELNALNKG